MANRLINEQSPYLLQHAHNPVDWYPWGDEAFDKAKAEHKPVIVSIGYAACHWCHVMEHESFENEETAAFMNQHFVCIKVDREEHPDVDHLYMDAVQAIGGSGGWPLNVFVTPERAPFYGGTYYPPRPAFNRPSWIQLLQRMTEIWHQQHDEVTLQASQMIQHLQQASMRVAGTKSAADWKTTRQIADSLLKQADVQKGGFGNAPKFPGTMAITFLLEHYHFTGYEPALQHALRSLDAMIEGGIYDQLGGGFARYATDRDWLIPHFEKMLYDNALLICVLCDAYSVTKRTEYLQIVQETIEFIERELKDGSGGYYCALDADSEGVEGKVYTWTWEEWVSVMGEHADVVAQYFGVSREGNWEGTNILHVAKSIDAIAASGSLSPGDIKRLVAEAKDKLFNARKSRIRPLTDDKSLLSWNALMNIALSKAGVAMQQADPAKANSYLQRAGEHMDWMLAAFGRPGTMLHTWKNGEARIPAKLDDYTYLVQALLQLAAATGKNDRILTAGELTNIVVEQFSREDGFFYYSSKDQKDIPVRKVDLYDGAIPSANAIMAHNLWILGMCMENTAWLEQAQQMQQHMVETATRYGYSFSYWAMLVQRSVAGMKTIAITGSGADSARSQIQEKFLPQVYCVSSVNEMRTLSLLREKIFDHSLQLFVCTEQACLPPANSVEEAFRLASASRHNDDFQ